MKSLGMKLRMLFYTCMGQAKGQETLRALFEIRKTNPEQGRILMQELQVMLLGAQERIDSQQYQSMSNIARGEENCLIVERLSSFCENIAEQRDSLQGACCAIA